MARIVIGVLLVLVGAVWFLQGIDVLGGSFMTGDILWSVIGCADGLRRRAAHPSVARIEAYRSPLSV